MENVEQLFRSYYPKMLLIARMMLGDQDEARDLVSDVFAEMLSGRLKITSVFTEGYFVVLVRNRCLNLLRRKTAQEKVKKTLLLDAAIYEVGDESSMANRMELEVDRLEDMLMFIDHDLTPQTSKIMNMHYRQKMTYCQIAAELGISEAAVYKHLAQGIKRIKEYFNSKNNGKD